ncbi:MULTISPECIES: helix-turn-helix transcriptional regulator [unclassified Cupriavidus]|uniref:helix-turn-helix transcriptional regulator n=1 Tax=unclassified Cupriavidus TaxID=2640874 RepID=UPI0010FA35A4|nr:MULTISPECIES: helix-turn-helix transcriptional regulator [unclassified Cupriavidus]MWL90334.1 helix-turn-helix transcriptional regulator [Cupriavidus sp. SW-Y-13]
MGEHLPGDDVFHRLVDRIYESAMDVAAMPAALDLFSRYTCSESPSYLIWDKLAGQARLGVTPHGCFTNASSMPESMRALPSRASVALATAGDIGDVGHVDAHIDYSGLSGGIRLFDTHDVCVWMSATPGCDRCTEHDCNRRVAHVMPHWARAARMQHRNFELSGLASLGLASLDTLDFGVMILQADMRVRYANSWAEALVQADTHLALDNGVLCAQPDSLQSVLARMLDNAAHGGRHGGAAAGSWMHITSGGQPVPIIVMPLVSRQPVEGPWQLPMAMMLLGNSESRSVLDAAVLTSLFGLSKKESIIAIRLAAGETLNEIAEREFLSPHTVRVHIRDTLRKTGTHRQSELVRLLHLLPGVDLERAGACSAARPRTGHARKD